MVAWWWLLVVGILTLLLGAIIGFFLTRMFFNRQLKNNPPINAAMIRAMYSRMGRKPSELQVQAVINAMKRNQG